MPPRNAAAAIQTLLGLGAPISAFAFNADASQVAVCPSTNEVQIYALSSGTNATTAPAQCLHVLCGHDLIVTSIDWAPRSNKIVTCSQDRNAYVWVLEGTSNTWTPTLVLLRINRAATCARWAPSEKKFAVASGARCVSVCHFEPENDWWVSKHIRKPLRSTVLSLAWHDNSVLLATGGTDGAARVFSAFIKAVDERPAPSAWGEKLPFGTVCADASAPTGAWVHAVEFLPNADALVFLTHDASANEYCATKRTVVSLQLPHLPPTTMVFSAPDTIIAAGHDAAPIVLRRRGAGEWVYAGLASSATGENASTSSSMGSANSALAKFRAMDSKSSSATKDDGADSVHHGCIRSIRRVSETTIATAGSDGRLVLWDTLGPAFKSLKMS